MNKEQYSQLEKMLINVGDLGFRRRVVEIITGLDIKTGDKILDCGCGEGFYTTIISSLFPNIEITAFDHDVALVEKAKKWIGARKNVVWVTGDICNMLFEDNYFDKIILSEVLEHIPDDFSALMEVKRVIKKEGIIVITVPNHNYPFFWDPLNWWKEHLGMGHFNPSSGFFGGIWAMHLRLYYLDEIKNLVKKAGLKINKIKLLTHYCFPFNHNILYAGKQFYTRLPVPSSVKQIMEKFEWEKASKKKNNFNPIRIIFQCFEFIDNFNTRLIKENESSMGILLFCQK